MDIPFNGHWASFIVLMPSSSLFPNGNEKIELPAPPEKENNVYMDEVFDFVQCFVARFYLSLDAFDVYVLCGE